MPFYSITSPDLKKKTKQKHLRAITLWVNAFTLLAFSSFLLKLLFCRYIFRVLLHYWVQQDSMTWLGWLTACVVATDQGWADRNCSILLLGKIIASEVGHNVSLGTGTVTSLHDEVSELPIDTDCKSHRESTHPHLHTHTYIHTRMLCSFRSMRFNPLSCCLITYRPTGASLLTEGHELISVGWWGVSAKGLHSKPPNQFLVWTDLIYDALNYYYY